MHTHHATQQGPSGWRKNWFVQNVLKELPIIGSFFHTKNTSEILQHACKSTAMLIGGSTAMLYGMMSNDRNMAIQMTEMGIGMTLGAVVYNGTYNAGRMCYQYRQFILDKKAIIASNTVQIENQLQTASDEPVSPSISESDNGFSSFRSA